MSRIDQALTPVNATKIFPPVICLLDEQQNITQTGGTMRLGSQPAKLMADSKAEAAYGQQSIEERHRHRYEFNNEYRTQFEDGEAIFSGTRPDGGLVEIIEVPTSLVLGSPVSSRIQK